ncbi:MAG: FAD-binding oxidoreductase [bacterium]|nr:FAD-binding oxidoreductase [bacterium]
MERKRAGIPESVKKLYSTDATVIDSGKIYIPEKVYFPVTEDEVVSIIRSAYRKKVPLYFRGGGTGMTGGCIVSKPKAWVISSEKLIKIIDLNLTDEYVDVESGVIPDELNSYLNQYNYFYPPAPASSGFSTIGGNISENSNGLNVFKYGTTGDWVREIRFITGTGEKMKLGGKFRKSVAGYSLKDLIIGSEGTLGFIYSAKLSIMKIPEAVSGFMIFFDSSLEGIRFVKYILEIGLKPSIFEYIDNYSIKSVINYTNFEVPQNTKSAVILKFEGLITEVKYIEIFIKEFLSNFELCGHLNTSSSDGFKEIMEFRKAISPALFSIERGKVNEDLVIPISLLEDYFKFIKTLERKYKMKIAVFGHIGFGNLHTNIMFDPGKKDQVKTIQMLLDELFMFVIDNGGSISGEHGIGITKKAYLKKEVGNVTYNIFKDIKKIFDPRGIINPGKMF